ncbi:MAG: ABC transporter permease subunit [Terracoccus sp.]
MTTRTTGRAGTVVVVILVALWFVVPLVPILLWAVADQWNYPGLLPQRFGIRGWVDVASNDTLLALGRSAALGTSVAIVATVAGAAAGRALGWRLVRRRGLLAVVLLAPVALPPFAVAMGLTPVLIRARVPETLGVAVVLTVFALPYTCYVFAAAYAGIDPAVEEQARLLGATPRQALARVTLPTLRPAIAAAAFLAFLVGWSDYIVTLVIGGGQLVTLPLLIAAAASGSGNEPVLAALSIVSVLPPVLALLIGRRLLRRQARASLRPSGGPDGDGGRLRSQGLS